MHVEGGEYETYHYGNRGSIVAITNSQGTVTDTVCPKTQEEEMKIVGHKKKLMQGYCKYNLNMNKHIEIKLLQIRQLYQVHHIKMSIRFGKIL